MNKLQDVRVRMLHIISTNKVKEFHPYCQPKVFNHLADIHIKKIYFTDFYLTTTHIYMNDKEQLLRSQTDESLKDWRIKQKSALELLQIVGDLRFDKSIELVLFRRPIYDARPSEVINNLGHAISYISGPITIDDCLDLAKAIDQVKNVGGVHRHHLAHMPQVHFDPLDHGTLFHRCEEVVVFT